ncbi:uncharacterized protein [Parasteatoda tepidariorum]|uniref:uncharacterized protein n=1 Tax=Parasteatoda tepidariorum TaxID=114398 RepID=UPI001C7249BD|nr:uncharacterized protein LOC107441748 [Parasteatoda tepidariorum]
MTAHNGRLIILFLVVSVLICIKAGEENDKMDVGEYQPLTPTKREKKMCEDKAEEKGKTIKDCSKKIHHTCYVQCWYKENDEKDELMTPDGTLCCDIGGAMPTGVRPYFF